MVQNTKFIFGVSTGEKNNDLLKKKIILVLTHPIIYLFRNNH